MRRPRIGVAGRLDGGRGTWLFTRHVIARSGGQAIRLRERDPIPQDLDGLLLGGGEDIDSRLYATNLEGEEQARSIRETYEEEPVGSDRDRFEMELLKHAERLGWPTLGICRGSQLINVAAGGTLDPDITPKRPSLYKRRLLYRALPVVLESDTRLAEILKVSKLRTNCLHRQAVDRPGRSLRIVARDRYGVTQAIEGTEERFLVGVQWHPELIPSARSTRRLFRAFVHAAALFRDVNSPREALPLAEEEGDQLQPDAAAP